VSDASVSNLRPPFERGNEIALRHGAYSLIRLRPRAEEIAQGLDGIVPAVAPADEPTIRLAALALAQVEAVAEYLDENGIVDENGQAQPVVRHFGTMLNTAARLLDRLGCTPTSRAALGLDLTRARGEALRLHLERYADAEGG